MKSECLIVTQCFYPDLGGIEGLMTGLADHCALAGRPVTVLAERVRRAPPAPLPDKSYPILRFGGPRPWRRWRKKSCVKRILKERRDRIAGIFADSWKSIEALPEGIETPVAVLAHGMEFPPDATGSKRQRIAAALARTSAVIANSRYTAELVRPYLGTQAQKLRIVLPPIAPIQEPEMRALAAMKDRIAGRRPLIATVARLEPRKGIDAVIRAMPELLRQHPGSLYAVAGAGGDRARLEELARSLGVTGPVLFLGRVSDAEKAALLSMADIFAMPVRREGRSVEGFGLSYLEAAWFGVPSLAGREGGAAEAIVDGETGLVCDGASQEDVTLSLLRLLDDKALRKRLGSAAQQRVKSELIWPAVIGRYLESFEPA